MEKSKKAKLGLFLMGGVALFILAIFVIGKQQNLFSPVFMLSANFRNISGQEVCNNVSYTGINLGTVDDINFVNDSTVRVSMVIRTEVQRFIKTDCEAGIASEGIVGDKLVLISHGGGSAPSVRNGNVLASFFNNTMDCCAIFKA